MVDTTAMAWCFGYGADGQLGTGRKGRTSTYDYYRSTIPVQVAGSIPFYSVSAGT